MGEPADGDEIDAARGDLGDIGEETPPEASVIARPSTILTASVNSAGLMLSSRIASAPSAKASCNWVERIHLDFDLHKVPDIAFRPPQCLRHTAGDGDMIVLDQHGIVEAEAMIVPPPARTAYFSIARKPGVVLRVQTICALWRATAATKLAVAVAIPLR